MKKAKVQRQIWYRLQIFIWYDIFNILMQTLTLKGHNSYKSRNKLETNLKSPGYITFLNQHWEQLVGKGVMRKHNYQGIKRYLHRCLLIMIKLPDSLLNYHWLNHHWECWHFQTHYSLFQVNCTCITRCLYEFWNKLTCKDMIQKSLMHAITIKHILWKCLQPRCRCNCYSYY